MLGHCTVYNRRNCSHIHDRITHIQSTHTHTHSDDFSHHLRTAEQTKPLDGTQISAMTKIFAQRVRGENTKKKKKIKSKQGRTRRRVGSGCGGARESVSAPRNQSGPDILARPAADRQIGAVAASFSLYLSFSPTPTSILYSQFGVSMTKTLLPQAPQQYTTTPPPPSA